VLALWYVCTVLGQIVDPTRLKFLVEFSLLPQWSFFAPNPGIHDFYLLYRDLNSGGATSSWTQVRIASRRWFNFAWNPDRRARKALFDLATSLAQVLREDVDAIELSIPYIGFLSIVSAQPHNVDADRVQFCIMMNNPSMSSPNLMFVSGKHYL